MSRPPAPDRAAEQAARERQARLTKPAGSLGRLEDLACWLAARLPQPLTADLRVAVTVFAADHGVTARGVSAYPPEVTAQMLANFAHGGAAINVLSTLHGCRLDVVDVGVAADVDVPGVVRRRVRAGTRDLRSEAALSAAELHAALSVGAERAAQALAAGAQLLIAGDMGIGNTTAAACLICALTGAAPQDIVGRGTGVDDAGLARKLEVVQYALERAGCCRGPGSTIAMPASDAHRLLQELGGIEIAAMTGYYLHAAAAGVPVLLDGFISAAAALCAVTLEPAAREFMLAAHRSAEGGHAIALRVLGLAPLLDLGLRLGEGSGATLAVPLLRAALALHLRMATFEEAGVSAGSA